MAGVKDYGVQIIDGGRPAGSTGLWSIGPQGTNTVLRNPLYSVIRLLRFLVSMHGKNICDAVSNSIAAALRGAVERGDIINPATALNGPTVGSDIRCLGA